MFFLKKTLTILKIVEDPMNTNFEKNFNGI